MSNVIRLKTQTFGSSFTIVPENGRWRATRADGLVSGLFFEREAALRFARHSSPGETSRTFASDHKS
jgi:hypothetical protein